MRGNSLADEYAKAGVELHGVTEQHSLEIRALAKIAYQAARWATIQYTTMVQEQHKDSDMLQPKQKPVYPKRKAPQPKQQSSTTGPESARHKYKYNSHHIKAATVSDGTLVLFCSTCGAYKWKRTGKLGSVCPGHPTGAGAKQRINMLNALRFPNSAAHLSISPHRAPTAQELLTIRLKAQPQHCTTAFCWRDQWNGLANPGGAALSRTTLLSAYGQTEASLRELTSNTAEGDARRAAAKHMSTQRVQPTEAHAEDQSEQSE